MKTLELHGLLGEDKGCRFSTRGSRGVNEVDVAAGSKGLRVFQLPTSEMRTEPCSDGKSVEVKNRLPVPSYHPLQLCRKNTKSPPVPPQP